jgi:hypothetical protein
MLSMMERRCGGLRHRLGEVVGDTAMRGGISAPPSSSAVVTSPVAAFTSGGPPRKMVPVPRTMTVSSLMAGT